MYGQIVEFKVKGAQCLVPTVQSLHSLMLSSWNVRCRVQKVSICLINDGFIIAWVVAKWKSINYSAVELF